MPSSTRCPAVRPLATALLLAAGVCATPAFAGKMVTSGLQTQQEFDQFIVKYRDGSIERRDVNALNRGLERAEQTLRTETAVRGFAKAGRADVKVRHHRRMSLGADVVRTGRRLDRGEAEALMRQIAADPNVEYVEVDVRMYPLLNPNDTHYGVQWGYNDADAGINAPAAWDVSTGSGIIVAVLDTGITSHSDLAANLVAGYDFVSSAANARDGNGRDSNPADEGDWVATANECYSGSQASNSSWHGTHVAGTVAAVTNNAKGVAGTAFGAKVMPVRVLAKCGGSISDIADAITWASGGTVSGVPTLASANVAKVINMSLGGGGACGTTTQNAINGAVSRGTTVIVAAGNSSNDASNNNPANCANVVTVAAIDNAGVRPSWSSYGSVVDVAAPGVDIASTINAGTTTPSTESYAYNSGTSMATPHVAGVAALVQSRRLALGQPLYTPAQLESVLKTTVRPFPVSQSRAIGTGIVNASAAVAAAGGGGGGGSTQTYSNGTDVNIRDNTTVTSTITVSGRSGNASSTTSVAVNIVHTYIGDLKVDLLAPDGSVYVLHNRSGGSADNIVRTYSVNLSTEALNGSWRLRVNDNGAGDIGYINSWSITF